MNVLFLTLIDFDSLADSNIYTDLLREFVKHGHKVSVLSPVEKRKNQETRLITECNTTILKLKIGNIQKTNIIEKGISTVMLESAFKRAIDKYFSDIKFDLILYSTPPITLVSAIEYVKRRDNAKTYLLLKDIFPQNAVDLGMLSKSGLKGFLYRHFRKQEKELYAISDKIGCMSPANVKYVIEHNPKVDSKKVEVCPNSIEIVDKSVDDETRKTIRQKYNIPNDKTVFVYGGNLGKPQGIPFLIDCLKECENLEDAYFLIVGDGTEYKTLEKFANEGKLSNLKLLRRLPKGDYDTLVAACDIGMIFLDHRFTIPNFPSRILSYMQAKLPILAVTDSNSDIGKIVVGGDFGWWCESNDKKYFAEIVKQIENGNNKRIGIKGYAFLKQFYCVENSYNIILNSILRETI